MSKQLKTRVVVQSEILMIGMLTIAFGFASPVFAADLNIAVQNNVDGAKTVKVAPGGMVHYRIVGILSDAHNDGLALWGANLSMTPSVLLSPATPGPRMGSFVRPDGITNPAGYGGTPSGNDLLQIGGGQNTIKNTRANAPFPIGNVVENIAQSEEVLATGSVTMPSTPGTYLLAVSEVFSIVIVDGQVAADGAFFKTEAAGIGKIENLTITVEK